MSPFNCPSLFTILLSSNTSTASTTRSAAAARSPRRMARLARRLGADIRLRTPAERIEFAGGRPVRRGRDRRRVAVPADAVVVGADFAHAIPTLIPEAHRPRWRDARSASRGSPARPSCSTSASRAAWARSGTTPSCWPSDYEQQHPRDIEAGDPAARSPRSTSSTPAPPTPAMAPPGHTSLYVLVPVPNLRAGIDWRQEAPRYRALVLQRLARLWPRATWSAASATSASSRPRTGATSSRSATAPPSTWPTTCGRCSTSARTTASRPASTSSAAAPTRAAACRSIYEGARISAGCCSQDFGMGAAGRRDAARQVPEPAAMDAAA